MPNTTGTMFFNPSSGAKIADKELEELKLAAAASGLEVIQLTREVNVAQTIRDRIARGIKLFVAAGGDGTITHVIQPLVETDAILGVIPVGTYNHFAKDMKIPLEWREALDALVSGQTRQVDVARVNERYFVNNLSIGLYPEMVAKREARGRDYSRFRARLYAAYHTIRKYPHVTLAIDTEHHHEVIRTHVFMVSNNSYDLSRIGVEAPRESLEGGRVSVYWLPHLPRIALMRFVARYLAGRVTATPGFRSFRTTQLRVQSRRPSIRAGIDGELMNLATPLTISIVPQSLNVRVPADPPDSSS
ncbi:MAG: diacylglycerol kinase family lipid kinase [Thermoanaerobaculia bacterium]|nr:diacylglycerol kinase family lipid kinase [Thermoanaerobaculia bacterium]